MKKRESSGTNSTELRTRLIGLGNRSFKKSYYPELRLRLDELERFRSVLDQTNDAILVINQEKGLIADTNQAWDRLVGRSREELVGKPLAIIAPEINARMAEQKAGHEVLVLHRVGKSPVACEVSLSFVEFGEHRFVVVVARDISSRLEAEQRLRDSEQRFRAVFEGTAIGMAMLGLDGRLQETNLGLQKMLGRSAAELRGASFSSFVHPDDRFFALRDFGALANGEQVQYRHERRYLRADGGVFWGLVAVSRINASASSPYVVVAIEDITNKKVAEQALHEASQVKDAFLAIVSHELRTPLSSILGWVHLLSRQPGEGNMVSKGLTAIERNVRVLTTIIDDLLDVSRIATGKLSLSTPRPLDLAPLANLAIEALRPNAVAKQQTIVTDVNSRLPLVTGDPVRLQQVVWNLVSNAIKFTPDCGKIEVALKTDGETVQISVADNGRGIAPEFMPRLFEKFYQVDSSTMRSYGGLGLGLAIVKYLVEAHSGTISVHSAGVNKGARFTVTLPAFKQVTETVVEKKASKESLDNVVVMVIEDDADTREIVEEILESEGARVKGAASVDEALSLVGRISPDVFLTDIAMPERDGYSLLGALRDQGDKRPVVAFSALTRNQDRRRAIEAGFEDYLFKPVDADKMVVTLNRVVGKFRRAPNQR